MSDASHRCRYRTDNPMECCEVCHMPQKESRRIDAAILYDIKQAEQLQRIADNTEWIGLAAAWMLLLAVVGIGLLVFIAASQIK